MLVDPGSPRIFISPVVRLVWHETAFHSCICSNSKALKNGKASKSIALISCSGRRIWLPFSICLDLSASFAMFGSWTLVLVAPDERLLFNVHIAYPNSMFIHFKYGHKKLAQKTLMMHLSVYPLSNLFFVWFGYALSLAWYLKGVRGGLTDMQYPFYKWQCMSFHCLDNKSDHIPVVTNTDCDYMSTCNMTGASSIAGAPEHTLVFVGFMLPLL